MSTSSYVKICLGVAVSLLARLPAYGLADADPCHLFPNGIQDAQNAELKVSKLQVVTLSCRANSPSVEQIATRRMTAHGEAYLLLVDTVSLKTSIEKESCWKCQPITLADLEASKFGSSLVREAKNFRASAGTLVLANAGLKHAERPLTGSILTADLCPSVHALDRTLIEDAVRLGGGLKPTPLALSASGGWLRHHKEDFVWLKELVRNGKLEITWVNHSNKHPFTPGLPNQENFLLRPGLDIEKEILETERLLVAGGVTPSVFFRFPGLISDAALMEVMKRHLLLAVGADAWLANGQKPTDGSIVLVHANGNEALGRKLLEKLIQNSHLPLPLHPLLEAVKD